MKEISIARAKSWANNSYFDKASRDEVQELLDREDIPEIIERFYKDLEFGTGGIRSIIGMGLNRINRYTIAKATQALALELLELPKKTEKKVAISFDNRRFSFDFAKKAAGVLAANGIHSYLFKRCNPVPLLSFSVRYHGADGGIMVTASHNPPEYNGYKVYWNDGCQITSPNDQNIIAHYNALTHFTDIKSIPFEEGQEKGLIHWVGKDVEQAYYQQVKQIIINPSLCLEKGHLLKLIYTPIHGTGLWPCQQVLSQMGIIPQIVAEQANPDEDFPTVKSPNPENPEALKLGVDLMKKSAGDLVFGTDPDTDRLGVAVWHKGAVHYPNGNQIGLLMLHYILQQKRPLPANSYIIKTIVTSNLLETLAQKFHVGVENTLTGFKWICRRLREIENSDSSRYFLFGTEESFGYLNHTFTRDKDGVSAVALMAEIALWYKTQKMTLIDGLDQIYDEFGFSSETLLCLDYFNKTGAEKIMSIMEHFRQKKPNAFGPEEVLLVADYQQQKQTHYPSGRQEALEFPISNVLGFTFRSGNKLFLRPSGTEPKIKFYIMIQEKSGDLEEKKQKASRLTENFITFIKEEAEQA